MLRWSGFARSDTAAQLNSMLDAKEFGDGCPEDR